LTFPTYNREVLESNANSTKTNETLLNGTGIKVSNLTLRDSNNHGIRFTGTEISVEDVLVDSTDWLGTLKCDDDTSKYISTHAINTFFFFSLIKGTHHLAPKEIT
jgi:hypothetical protein